MESWKICCLKFQNIIFCEWITVALFLFIFVVLSLDCWFQNLPLSGYGVIFLSLAFSLCVAFCVGRGISRLQKIDKNDSILKTNSSVVAKARNWVNEVLDNYFENEFKIFNSRCSLKEQIRLFIKDIEQNYVKPWYEDVSTNPSFLFDCHLILDEVIFKFIKKLMRCHAKFCIRNLLYLYLGHIQELKRSDRRATVNENAREVENLYRCCHPGSISDRALNHYLTNLMDILVREHAPHDLVSSLQSSIVIRILARKVLKTIIVNIEDPRWIYSRMLCAIDYKVYQSVMKGGSYVVKERTEAEPEIKKKFQMNTAILSRKTNLENNIFHKTLGSKAFISNSNRSNDKNLLSLPLVSTKTEPNISSVLGNLISSTAAPLLPENASLCYQPFNKMWLSPLSEINHEVTETNAKARQINESIDNEAKDEVFPSRSKVLTRSKSSDAMSPDVVYQPLTKKDISIGEDLVESLHSAGEYGKKLVKTQSFDEGSNGDLVDAHDEKDKGGNASPVYEEPEDFATTIAKLRTVLQQRESTSTASESSNKSIEYQDTFSRDNTIERMEDPCDGPQTASDVPSDGRPVVDIYITGTEVKESSNSAYVLYTIEYNGIYMRNCENGESQLVLQPTTIKRRFQEFLNLQARLEENAALKPYLKGIKSPTKWLSLPFSTKTDEATTATRRPVLEKYLRELCDRVEIAVCPDLHEFLAYGSTAVSTFHSAGNNSSMQKIDKYLSNKVTGVFNSIKTVLPSFDGNFSVADAKEVKELKSAPEQNLLQGFLNFGNKSEDVQPIALNFLISESMGDAITDAIRHYLSRKSECIEDALDVLDNSDWHSEQGECHATSVTGACVWASYHDVLIDDDLDKCNDSPLVNILIDILCELLDGTDCWATKQPIVNNLKKIATFWELEIEVRLCNLDWDRIFGNVLMMLRTALFTQETSNHVQLDLNDLYSTLVTSISSAMPVWMLRLLGRESVDTAARNLLNSFKYSRCNRDLLLRLCDIMLSQLLSCPHLLPADA